MGDYTNQMMNSQYGMNEMIQSPVGMHRMTGQHPSPQQQHGHMMQQNQMMSQQAMIMQSNQPMQMPPCTFGSSMPVHQLNTQMTPHHMMTQQGIAIMTQSGQMPPQVLANGQGPMMQVQHQLMAGPSLQQQQQQQMICPSIGQSPMMASICQPNQQNQPHQMMQPTSQMMSHQPMSSQQPVGHSPGFALPSPSHMRGPPPGYQQTSPHRPTMNRYPTPSPENVQHSTPMYRPHLQRPIAPARIVGQSSAIRQALGHLPSTPSTSSVQPAQVDHVPAQGSFKLLEKDALEALIKSVDPLETVEDDVSDALLQLVEEFVDDVIDHTARVAKHRSATKLETKDVQYVLERRYKIFLPPQPVIGIQPGDHNPYSKPPATEAHRQRMNLIKKIIQKP